MNLDKLKPAWQQFRLMNSMQPMNQQEILLMLETAEALTTNKTNRVLLFTIALIVLTFCCQGG